MTAAAKQTTCNGVPVVIRASTTSPAHAEPPIKIEMSLHAQDAQGCMYWLSEAGGLSFVHNNMLSAVD